MTTSESDGPAGGRKGRRTPKGAAPKFEEAMASLEEIVRRLESGELGLDDALVAYQRGVEAVRACRKILEEAEGRLEVLVKESGGAMRLEPMEERES